MTRQYTPPVRRWHKSALSLMTAIFLVGAGPVATAFDTDRQPRAGAVPAPQATVRTPHGMVVSAKALASAVGIDILKAGGNAIDAAIATGFALAVTHPTAGNIGGGGFFVIRFPDGTVTSFDFREKAPLAAHSRMFLDENGEYSSQIHHLSHLSVGVPGTVAGFVSAHEKYGNLEWNQVVEPAVSLARDGFAVMPGLARSLARALRRFEPYPA